MYQAFLFGGTANTVSQGAQNMYNEDYGLYDIAQSFVGGGLSGMAGAGYGGAKAKGIFPGKSKLGKYGNSFAKYSAQSTAYDFAYSSQEDFWDNRTPLDHFGMFVAGGVLGAMSGEVFKGSLGLDWSDNQVNGWRLTTAVGLMGADYSISALIKDRSGNFYGGRSQRNKGGAFGLKYFSNTFNYLRW